MAKRKNVLPLVTQEALSFITTDYNVHNVLASSVAQALKRCGLSRDHAAELLSNMTHKVITREMLDHYASTAHPHEIPVWLIKPFCIVTGSTAVIEVFLNGELLIKGKDIKRLELIKKNAKLKRLEIEIAALNKEIG